MVICESSVVVEARGLEFRLQPGLPSKGGTPTSSSVRGAGFSPYAARNGLKPALQAGVAALVIALLAAGTATAQDASPSLRLFNGAVIRGELKASPDAQILRWRSPHFTQPFDFPLSAVEAVDCTVSGPRPERPGEYCFEMQNDDILYGNLVKMTKDEIEVDSGPLGRLHLRREQVRRLSRWQTGDLTYLGPNGLAGWKDLSATPQWRDEGGQPASDQWGATLFGDIGIPDKAVIEVELSWRRKADFVFALAVNEGDVRAKPGNEGLQQAHGLGVHRPDQQAFHLVVWDDQLVLVGESSRDADLVSVQPLAAGDGHVRLLLHLDQEQRRLILLSLVGKPLATLKIRGKKPRLAPGVSLTNHDGDVRLEHLRVSRWNGTPPREVRAQEARLRRLDGSIVYGEVTAYDAQSKRFTVRDGRAEAVVKNDETAEVFLMPSPLWGKANSGPAAKASLFRVTHRDGSRFSGTLAELDNGRFTFACPGVKEPLRLWLAEVGSVSALKRGPLVPTTSPPGRDGRLELDGVRMQGRLVDGHAAADSGWLVWHPDFSLNSSPLRLDVSGRIVYREPPPPPPKPASPQFPGRRVFVGGPAPANPAETAQPASPATPGRRSLHLRTGDTIPCEVTAINEKGILFQTPLSDARFVPHEKVKSVELVATRDAPRLDDPKWTRLLTVPRMQKRTLPTQLICSTNGDFVRGRLLEMDDKNLKIEVRLETRVISRERVAQIIWFHADELTPAKSVSSSADASRRKRVQTMSNDGNRLTFAVEKADHETIAGRSDVIGGCRAEVASVDQLLFGTLIEESASKLAYHAWRLHHAVEPKFIQAGSNGSTANRPEGTESPLVGQPAFPLKLDMLEGSPFDLALHKDRVVILDFWATWCGPCLESLPEVDTVAREFAGKGVELFAVNMEEQSERIRATLERHKLKLAVLLDRDGVVAAKYAVTAIPQTVVIGRDGKVARVFVGGGKKTADSLRKALLELSVGKTATERSR